MLGTDQLTMVIQYFFQVHVPIQRSSRRTAVGGHVRTYMAQRRSMVVHIVCAVAHREQLAQRLPVEGGVRQHGGLGRRRRAGCEAQHRCAVVRRPQAQGGARMQPDQLLSWHGTRQR